MLVELEQLEVREREVSAIRRKLHDRLDTFPNEITAKREQEVSKERRQPAPPDRPRSAASFGSATARSASPKPRANAAPPAHASRGRARRQITRTTATESSPPDNGTFGARRIGANIDVSAPSNRGCPTGSSGTIVGRRLQHQGGHSMKKTIIAARRDPDARARRYRRRRARPGRLRSGQHRLPGRHLFGRRPASREELPDRDERCRRRRHHGPRRPVVHLGGVHARQPRPVQRRLAAIRHRHERRHVLPRLQQRHAGRERRRQRHLHLHRRDVAAGGQQVPTPTGTISAADVLIDVQGTADLTNISVNGVAEVPVASPIDEGPTARRAAGRRSPTRSSRTRVSASPT